MDDQHTILDQTYAILIGTYLNKEETRAIKGNTLEIFISPISLINAVEAACNKEKDKCKPLISINWVSLLIILNNALKL